MSKCLDPFRFLLISLAVWMNQQWPISTARSSRVVMTAATLASVMNGWHAGDKRRVHDFGVSCLIRGASGTLADSQIPKFRTEMQPLVGLGIRRIEFSGHTGYGDRNTGERVMGGFGAACLRSRYLGRLFRVGPPRMARKLDLS